MKLAFVKLTKTTTTTKQPSVQQGCASHTIAGGAIFFIPVPYSRFQDMNSSHHWMLGATEANQQDSGNVPGAHPITRTAGRKIFRHFHHSMSRVGFYKSQDIILPRGSYILLFFHIQMHPCFPVLSWPTTVAPLLITFFNFLAFCYSTSWVGKGAPKSWLSASSDSMRLCPPHLVNIVHFGSHKNMKQYSSAQVFIISCLSLSFKIMCLSWI